MKQIFKIPIRTNKIVRFVFCGSIIALFVLIIVPLSSEEVFRKSITSKGSLLVFSGRVLDKKSRPITNASVEIWQTDTQGIYNHPGDSNNSRKDMGFQFFGTSISNSSGEYIFRTVIPGQYEPRPRHIHFKIRLDGKILLVSQIYFSIDSETSGVGGSNRNLLMDLITENNPDGRIMYIGEFDFIIDIGVSGELKLTDSQSEGPYYPLVDVSQYDNDLVNVSPEL